MALPTRWNPFRQLGRLDPLVEIDDLFRNFAKPMYLQRDDMLDMRMDVSEDDKGYRVTVDIPGVKKSDIDVSIEGNQVTINAEVSREKSHESEKEVHCERYSGKAYRSFTLPSEVDAARSEARYDNGVLTLALPRKAGSQSKHLPIH